MPEKRVLCKELAGVADLVGQLGGWPSSVDGDSLEVHYNDLGSLKTIFTQIPAQPN